jgi:rod shape-determining protein MreC
VSTVLGEVKAGSLLQREPRRFGVMFLLAFSLSMIVFSLYGAQASVFERARATVLDVFEPVLTVVSAPIRWVGDRVGHVEDYFRLHSENKRLREENAELRMWMHQALSLRRQLSYYESVLGTRLPGQAAYIDAQVIGESNGPYDHALILSAGQKDGVATGSAVIDNEGLIGHVVSAGNGAARVLLVTDYESRVPVFIEDRQVEALLAGRSADRPVLEFLSERPERALEPGLRLVTSGAGGRLPRGIPVGEIRRVDAQRIEVDLYANWRSPDLVRVVDYQFPNDVEPTDGEASAEVGDASEQAATIDG